MARRPIILITPSNEAAGAEFGDESVSLSNCYPDAIHEAGGVPLILPRIPSPELISEALSKADGLVLTGGDDIQCSLHRPRLRAALREKGGETDPKRDLMELLLINEALAVKMPLLAICRGHQLLNVALGGTLFVDIASERPGAMRHNCSDQKDAWVHEVSILPGSLMAQIVGDVSLRVNSCHHQAVKSISPALQATASSPDGIIEAMELKPAVGKAHPFALAVQFHPERMFRVEPAFYRMFKLFVEACLPAKNS